MYVCIIKHLKSISVKINKLPETDWLHLNVTETWFKKLKTTTSNQLSFSFQDHLRFSRNFSSFSEIPHQSTCPVYFAVGRRYKTTQSQQTNFRDRCRCFYFIFPLQTGKRRGCVHFRPVRAQTLLWFFAASTERSDPRQTHIAVPACRGSRKIFP